MAVKLSETDLPQLYTWLEEHLPQSFKIHGELKTHLRGENPNLDFFVDRWPNPQAAIAAVNTEGLKQMGMSGTAVLEGVFGVNDEALKKLVKDPSAVSWDSVVIFAAAADCLKSVLTATAQEMGKAAAPIPATLLKATAQDLKPIPVPEGMKFEPFSNDPKKVTTIHRTWQHADKAPEDYIRQQLKWFPSMYLVMDSGDHVGHMTGNSHGAMGMLYVNPEFRRKGYGTMIVSHLAQKYFDQGDDAFVFIEDYNAISYKLHEALGFKAGPESRFLWMICS